MTIATQAFTGRAPRPATAMLGLLRRCLARHRQRRQLAALDDTRLHDLGLTRAAAQAEAAKPFWRG